MTTTIESLVSASFAFASTSLESNPSHAGWAYISALSLSQMEVTVLHWGNKSVWGMKASAKALADAIVNGVDEKVLAYRGYKPEFVNKEAPKPAVKSKRSVTTEDAPKTKAKAKAKRAKRAIAA